MNRKLSGIAMVPVWLVVNTPSWVFLVLGIVGMGGILAWCIFGRN